MLFDLRSVTYCSVQCAGEVWGACVPVSLQQSPQASASPGLEMAGLRPFSPICQPLSGHQHLPVCPDDLRWSGSIFQACTPSGRSQIQGYKAPCLHAVLLHLVAVYVMAAYLGPGPFLRPASFMAISHMWPKRVTASWFICAASVARAGDLTGARSSSKQS
jgi:hypothetical protein